MAVRDQSYAEFLASKVKTALPAGFDPKPEWLPGAAKPHQRDIVRWNCRMGRSADFAGIGLGKTLMELGFLDCCRRHTGEPSLLLAPLNVAPQIVREADRFGIEGVHLAASQADIRPGGIAVTNYQKLHKFDHNRLAAVGGDESSIVKSHDGKTRNAILDFLAPVAFRLLATATPAPNDHEELGNHAELLGIMTRSEMLATFFVHDSGDTSEWRLKGHAEGEFWAWVATWAVLLSKPSDLGYDDTGYDLPPLEIHEHWVESGAGEGRLFAVPETTLTGQRKARRQSLAGRCDKAARLADGAEPVLLWCNLNDEGDLLEKIIPGSRQVAGVTPEEERQEIIEWFTDGSPGKKVLISKPSVFGFGLNLQCCARQVFVGLSHSYEQFFQAIGRSHRFGQTRPVDVHIVSSEAEAAVMANIRRKQAEHETMVDGMLSHTRGVNRLALSGGHVGMHDTGYRTDTVTGPGWELHKGDNVEVLPAKIADDSVGYSIFSPPFADLYVYSASQRDMGNARTYEEFTEHFGFLVRELYRVLIPGRLVSFHCFQIPLLKERDGEIGLRDFRGHLIAAFQRAGFVFHSEVCIWKDPVVQMQRTKALGLLHAQIKKDSCRSRQGIADYLVTMRKPGTNPEPVTGRFDGYIGEDGPEPIIIAPEGYHGVKDAEQAAEKFSIEVWQRYASPVWHDINQGRVLSYAGARSDKDERHICPLQLDVIERCLELWSNPGDLVLSPFAGIGSEGYCSVKAGRRFVGVELKESYFNQAILHLKRANAELTQRSRGLFDDIPDECEGAAQPQGVGE